MSVLAYDPSNRYGSLEVTAILILGGKNEVAPLVMGSWGLTFGNPPDYGNPTDWGSNNVYQVTVKARDEVGNTASLETTVTVTHVEY